MDYNTFTTVLKIKFPIYFFNAMLTIEVLQKHSRVLPPPSGMRLI